MVKDGVLFLQYSNIFMITCMDDGPYCIILRFTFRYSIGVGSGGGRGGDSPPPPNFTHCLHNELHCSIVDRIACRHCSSRKSHFCCLKKCRPPKSGHLPTPMYSIQRISGWLRGGLDLIQNLQKYWHCSSNVNCGIRAIEILYYNTVKGGYIFLLRHALAEFQHVSCNDSMNMGNQESCML